MLYLRLITFLVRADISVNSKMLLVTDFVNLKIKLSQSFKDAHRDMMYIRVFIGVSNHIYVCTVKKIITAGQ
jgi:hypothetical protein